jgi:hypothetical protein
VPTSTPTPRRWFGPWCSTWTAQRPLQRGRMPYGVPSAQLGHPEPPERSCASGLRAGLSGVQDTESTGDPQRFLARIQHGLDMALDADRAYTHRLTKTPDHPTWRTFWERPDLTSWGSYVTTLATVCRCVSTTGSGGGGEERVTLFDGLRKGHIEHGWATRIGTCGSVLVAHADALNAFASPHHNTRSASGGQERCQGTWTNITPTAFSKIQAERGKPERSE